MIIQSADPICYKSKPLPHALSGVIEIGTITQNTAVTVAFTGCSLNVTKRYNSTSDTNGVLLVTIPDSDSSWFTAFEECCYKVHVLDDTDCTIPFTINGLEIECVRMCLQIDCEADGPYKLDIYAEEVTETNCNQC